jgi:non-specific serine/threonine protein kinase
MEVVWWFELDRWQPYDMLMSIGSAHARHEVIMDAVHMAREGTPFFLIINPAQLRGKDAAHIMATNWTTVTVDEFHKCGLSNPKTATSKALHALKAQKRIALSGTPIGGKVARLWAVLNWLEQETFKSKWNWIKTWLETTKGYGGSLEAGEIKRWRLEEFNEYHAQFMVRRLREEVRTELPDKQRMDIWVTLDDPAQAKQYRDFARAAEIRIEEESLSATSILAEYTRLRQFAIAEQRLVKEATNHKDGTRTEFITPYPTMNSCKLPQVQRILEEQGVIGEDQSPITKGDGKREHAQVIIFSQFSKVVDMTCEWLMEQGIPEEEIGRITGAVSERERGPIIKRFEAGNTYRVLAMTSTAGGMSITLNQSDAIIFLDETFNPDDQTQAEDRNRENTAEIYYIRTRGTIEEYVYSITREKMDTNWNVLDLRRLGLRADRIADEALAAGA